MNAELERHELSACNYNEPLQQINNIGCTGTPFFHFLLYLFVVIVVVVVFVHS